MGLIYVSDVVPILTSGLIFSMLAMAHRVFLPNKYSAFLQFKEEEDVNKTVQSTIIRIIYLIVGTCVLNILFGFGEKQICIGIIGACFLNVWPAIIQHQLLKLKKTQTEWLILTGYIVFIGTSCFVAIVTVRLFIPVLRGDSTVYWLDNQAITFLLSLIMMAFPIPLEAIISKFACVVVVQTIDTFIEEVYILEHQLNMECPQIEKNNYLIDRVARENDISIVLLETILRLEVFYRGRVYNKILEKLVCIFLGKLAIKKDISVGIAQIRLSTAKEILRENPEHFIKRICEDNLNIEICGKLLKSMINKYGDLHVKDIYEYENYEDIFDYIACKYIGASPWKKDKIALVYSAVLRTFMKEEKLYYRGSKQTGRCLVCISKDKPREMNYEKVQKFVEEFGENIVVYKKVFVKEYEFVFEFICDDEYYIGIASDFAKENECVFEVFEK